MRRALVLLTLAALAGCARREPLPVLGQVPEFTLTDQTGAEFTRGSLDGKVWVAEFFFTSCMGPCPRMNAQFRKIQNETTDLPNVRLVSFTVDPEGDTPEVMAAYGKRFQADPARWRFLTGPVETLDALCDRAFHLGRVDGEDYEHSTRFVLVDQQARIRGYYDSSNPEDVRKLIVDLRRLAR